MGPRGAKPGDSEVDLSIATFLALESIPASEIEHALLWRRRDLGSRAHGPTYYSLTVGKAIATAEEHRVREKRRLSLMADAADDLDRFRTIGERQA